MAFSRRSGHDEAARNALTAALDVARATGRALVDLTVSNPTAADLPYPREAILAALASEEGLLYEPDPLGMPVAREAVSAELEAQGTPVPPERIAITASTSEAYGALFTLLCDPGDEVLVPSPSYPLLGWLAAYASVTLRPYPLFHAGRWHVDVGALRDAVTERTRAIVVVAPNNPTGSYVGREELDAMLDLGFPIVSDEVFARYPLGDAGRIPEDRVPSALVARRGLVFALSGLSKLAGLPQLKLGWIAVSGDEARVAEAMDRLALVLDAYLSVGAPVQHALPAVLAVRHVTTAAITARTRKNLATLRATLRSAPAATLLDVEGGWYAIIRLPATQSDEDWTMGLLASEGVHVQPGYFFDMQGAHVVVSLLTPELTFAEGAARLARFVTAAL